MVFCSTVWLVVAMSASAELPVTVTSVVVLTSCSCSETAMVSPGLILTDCCTSSPGASA
jgi:hypothetical protein